jgi:RES domain-containing protein
MLPEKQLAVALGKIAGVPMHGPFSRAVALQYLFPKPAPAPRMKAQPLWGIGSKLYGGRYTPKNYFETVYVATDMVTALAEVTAIVTGHAGPPFTLVTGPWVVVAIHGTLSSVLDLTVPTTVHALGSNYQELTGAWRYNPGQIGEPPTHVLGRVSHKSKRFDGICFPSSKNPPHGTCVAVFPDRLKGPAYLEIYDPQKNIAQRLP